MIFPREGSSTYVEHKVCWVLVCCDAKAHLVKVWQHLFCRTHVGSDASLGQQQQLIKEDKDRVSGLMDHSADHHSLGGHTDVNTKGCSVGPNELVSGQ